MSQLPPRDGGATATERFERVFEALEASHAAVRELAETCCQPLRSSHMTRLSETIFAAERLLASVDDDPQSARQFVDTLRDAGAQVGYLQVACCAPSSGVMTRFDSISVQRGVAAPSPVAHRGS